MDPYDSDSSGFEDEGDYTETNVLLGYASEEVLEDVVSHLGGWPAWLDNSTPPPGEFANCKVCNQPMNLLLELHGDLPEYFPNDERRLYIFSCPRKPCARKPGSIRALRAVRKTTASAPKVEPKKAVTEPKKQELQPQAPKTDIGASLFGSNSLTGSVSANSNPFSSSTAGNSNTNPFAAPAPATPASQTPKPSSAAPSAESLAESFADKVRVSSPPPSSTTQAAPEAATGPQTPWPSQSEFPEPYKQFYLDAEYETMSRPSTPAIPEGVTIDNTEEESGAGGSSDLKDALESELDKAFMKFSTRLAHNPEQILRYEFRGTPLLYSHADAVGKRLHDAKGGASGARVTTVASGASNLPRCEYCGSERVFEFQLVPHAISVLEDAVGLDDAGMEWGTIILGVCNRDCGPQQAKVTGWREEWVGVQWEETK
ncbi:hypothetical protein FE257_002331 [Aspergillus nanangensis]|uniref:Programmed cell death protein 2 C-terminal domain-containing protein n=1 Tax=Aspergillus nanangensis TaxID=2582783 RepID=A0AAD4CCS1_ASPNN|nr:hypothetical protein FE257_002331 [Aspergillus nanangensis]